MTEVIVTGSVLSVTERNTKNAHFPNAILSELDGNRVAYQVVFWNDDANKVRPQIVEGGFITVAGCISKISNDKKFGPKIELAECELLSYASLLTTKVNKDKVEGVTSLPKEKEGKQNGTDA